MDFPYAATLQFSYLVSSLTTKDRCSFDGAVDKDCFLFNSKVLVSSYRYKKNLR